MTCVVAFHGFTASPAAFDPLRTTGLEVLAPYLAGHGRAPVDVTTFDDEVSRLSSLAKSCSERPILIGYSLGARLALGVLRGAAESFRACVLISVSGGLDDEADRVARLRADAEWALVLRRNGIAAFVEAWEQQPLFATQASLSHDDRQRRRAARLDHQPLALAAALEAYSLGRVPSARDVVRRVETPLTFVVGEADSKFVALGQRLATDARHGRLVVAPGAGHDVLLERPEFIVALVRDLIGDAP